MANFLPTSVLAAAALLLGCTQVTPIPPGSTPLANAVVSRQPEEVAKLLASGSSPDSADERGTSAIILAAATDQFRIANMLANGRANIWAADSMGYTAAVYANTSHIPDDSDEGKARLAFVQLLRSKGYPWPPPWPKDVLAMQQAGNWPPSSK